MGEDVAFERLEHRPHPLLRQTSTDHDLAQRSENLRMERRNLPVTRVRQRARIWHPRPGRSYRPPDSWRKGDVARRQAGPLAQYFAYPTLVASGFRQPEQFA